MRKAKLLSLAAFLLLMSLFVKPATAPAADKAIKVHILYSSDAVGYHEPCG